jgi:hypothetical protein
MLDDAEDATAAGVPVAAGDGPHAQRALRTGTRRGAGTVVVHVEPPGVMGS